MTAPSRENIWPVGMYAPGNYWCTCVSCGQTFTGDKRAKECPQCVIRALLAQRERDEKVGVKPLEWGRGDDEPRCEYSSDGSYQIFYTGSNAGTVLSFGARRIHIARFSGDVLGQKARLAAQADYERRILSALAARDAGGE